MNQMVVKKQQPWRMGLTAAALLLGAVLGGWGLFEYGHSRAGYDFVSVRQASDSLSELKKGLEEQLAEFRAQKAVLERSRQIEHEASKKLEQTISTLQGEISELKAELAFYRGIVSPREASEGLKVQSFGITENGLERGYRYKLVLTQVLKNDKVARGVVKLGFEGIQGEKLVLLDLKEVSPDGTSRLNFKFKYFQTFEGDVVFPKDFAPARVLVKVNRQGRGYGELEKVFDWAVEET